MDGFFVHGSDVLAERAAGCNRIVERPQDSARVNPPMKTIHRTHLTSDFTTLPNKLLRGESMSFAAKGILAMMLSHREDWEMDIGDLKKFGFEGRRAITRAVKELEASGYATRHYNRNKESGKFHGTIWNWYISPVPPSQRTHGLYQKRSVGKRAILSKLLPPAIFKPLGMKEEWQVRSGAELFKGLIPE